MRVPAGIIVGNLEPGDNFTVDGKRYRVIVKARCYFISQPSYGATWVLDLSTNDAISMRNKTRIGMDEEVKLSPGIESIESFGENENVL